MKSNTYARELLAIYMAITHVSPYVEGRELIVYMHHQPLCHAATTKQTISSRRNKSDIRNLPGALNPILDALSRIDEIDYPSPIHWKEISNMQQQHSELKTLLNGYKLKIKPINTGETEQLYCENSTADLRPCADTNKKRVFGTMHNLTHPSTRSTRSYIAKYYFRPRMNARIGNWARKSIAC